ncbi:hypothetical protein DFH09DRAFT_935771 [Mycena vulgaris]|nr:hypothetical protein DFH09DRAFT_935771 [Mycena vulgaris]
MYGAPAPAVYPSSQYTPPSFFSRNPDPSTFAVKQCYHCHATTTPLWRRDPNTQHTLCNACGLYLQTRHTLRPKELIELDAEEPEMADSDGENDGPECANCGTRKTSTWRRNQAGAQVCNACGVFERHMGRPRPLALRNDKIRPRAKR